MVNKSDLRDEIKSFCGSKDINEQIRVFVKKYYGEDNLQQFDDMFKRAIIPDPDKNLSRIVPAQREEERCFKKAFFSYYNSLAEILRNREEKIKEKSQRGEICSGTMNIYYAARKNFWYKEAVFFDYLEKRIALLKPFQVAATLLMLYPFINSISYEHLEIYRRLLKERKKQLAFELTKL